jgi:hypothetical protein
VHEWNKAAAARAATAAGAGGSGSGSAAGGAASGGSGMRVLLGGSEVLNSDMLLKALGVGGA